MLFDLRTILFLLKDYFYLETILKIWESQLTSWLVTGDRLGRGHRRGKLSSVSSCESFPGKIFPWSARIRDGKSSSKNWVTNTSAKKMRGSLEYLGAGWRDFLGVDNFFLLLDLNLKGSLYLKQEKDTSACRISLPYMGPSYQCRADIYSASSQKFGEVG